VGHSNTCAAKKRNCNAGSLPKPMECQATDSECTKEHHIIIEY
jgi:hypothetical protein